MKPFVHDFQRLPSEHELEYYNSTQPSTGYPEAPETSFQQSPAFYNTPQFQYEPVINNGSRRRDMPEWTSSPTIKILAFLSHLVLTLLPIAFIVLAFMALSVDGEPQSQRGRVVYQAAKLGPSIFPIVFAAVVGRLMRTFALWRAERGSTIGLLEQLNGSQNLLAAVERSFLLASLWGWGLVIIILWALSPIGGQSSLRVLELTQKSNEFPQVLHYFNPENYSETIFGGASSFTYGRPALQAIYQACLLAPASISSSSVDIWGNVKVPLMQAQRGYTGVAAQDWIDIVHDNDTVYSSLTGIVTSGLRHDADTRFSMQSSYINLTCPEPVVFGTGDTNANFTNISNDFNVWLGNVLIHQNKSGNSFDHGGTTSTSSDWNSFMVDSNFNGSQSSPDHNQPVNIIFASKDVGTYRITAYNCTVGFTRVESAVSCNGTACRVNRMRPSRQFTEPSTNTPWNQVDSYVPFYNMLYQFPWLSGTVHSAEVTPADFYVSGNNTPFQPPGIFGADYTKVGGQQVAQRLGTLLNTVWQASIAQSSIALPPPDQSVFGTTAERRLSWDSRTTESVMATNETVYHASKLWVGFTAAISLILFACGIAGMVFRYMTTAPDILGYVSTMTRDNPYFHDQKAPGGDALDGLERARLLRNVVVQISDVKPWQGSGGHIALRRVPTGEDRKSNRLNRGLQAPSALSRPPVQ